ncbi:MAG: hypothetical protein RH860_09790 [Cytophagales bacterium]
MNQKVTIPILLVIGIGLGVFLYFNYSSKVEEQIKIEKERLSEEKERKETLELKIDKLQEDIASSKSQIEILNNKIEELNSTTEELEASKKKIQSSLNTYSYLLKKEREKIADSKNQIVSLINKQLAELLDHRIRKISIFNDDSSFAYYTGRRNYITLDSKNNLKLERTIHFTSTGQYLQAIYQDKDNGNNRFLINNYNVPIANLDFESSSITDLSNKEKMAFEKDVREETYVNLEIPIIKSSAQIDFMKSIEYESERFDKKSTVKSIEFYTTSKEQAEEVLTLLKILDSLV